MQRIFREKEEPEPAPLGTIGNYHLQEEIGRGGQGIVYRALDVGLVPFDVAIKVLVPGAVSLGDAERFVDEVRRMRDIEHPHIVPYRASGNDRGQLYYVMRFMRGESLADHLKKHPGPVAAHDAARWMIQIVEAVSYLHRQDPPVVHCDLKPKNILLDESGNLFVADFGLAFLFKPGESHRKGCGTPPYAAPEQMDLHLSSVGPWSDIYGLGVILYELITGLRPESGGEPLPPSRIRRGIPDALDRVCRKCLARSTRDRYQSVAQLLVELNHFIKEEPLEFTPPLTAWHRVRDWARSEPALAVRLAVIVACSLVLWGHPAVFGLLPIADGHWANLPWVKPIIERLGPTQPVLIWANQVIFTFWGLASWAFQRRLTRNRDGRGPQLAWRLVDVLVLASLILLDDALMSPLTVSFAVLIGASAFWMRPEPVIQTTLLSILGYLGLIAIYWLTHGVIDYRYRHFHYVIAVSALGLTLMHQANRMQALIRICEAGRRS